MWLECLIQYSVMILLKEEFCVQSWSTKRACLQGNGTLFAIEQSASPEQLPHEPLTLLTD